MAAMEELESRLVAKVLIKLPLGTTEEHPPKEKGTGHDSVKQVGRINANSRWLKSR